MSRKTLRDARLFKIPQAIGLCAGDNDEFPATLNEAQLRIITEETQPDEGWWGTWAIMRFNLDATTNSFTTPRDVARVTGIDVCKKPVLLRNQFYEYMEFGTGQRPQSCSQNRLCENLGAWDRGRVVTFADLTPPNKKLRAYLTNASDAGKRVFYSGKDQFDNVIVTQDGLLNVTGEFVILGSPFIDTVFQYTELSGIQKDETNGPVQIFQVDTVTGDETLLVTMEPGETTASYRRYFVNGIPCSCCSSPTIQVSTLVKLDLIPAVVDTDYLLIGNLAALKEECQSIRMSDMDSVAAKKISDKHHAAALRILFGELDHYVGKEKVSIRVPIFGSDRLRRQPI